MQSVDSKNVLVPRPFWGTLKEKYKRIIEEHDETMSAFEFLLGMFEWEGLPETVRPEYLELYAMTQGVAAVRMDDLQTAGSKAIMDYVAMQTELGSDPDAYGLGTLAISYTENGHTYRDSVDSDDVAILWNNKTKTPCVDAYRVGSYVAEIDTSIDLLVWWSRASKLFLADENKVKQMLEEAFAALKKGTPMTVVSSNILAEIETGKKALEAIDLSDVDYADKLDKLAFIREKRFDWFKDRYGMCARDTGKMAQVSVDEANGGTGASMIIPLNMLWCRQKFAEECNRKFGWNCSVHFAGAWLGEMERYETTVVANGEIDIDQYDAVEHTQEGAESDENGENIDQNNTEINPDEGGVQDQNGEDPENSTGDDKNVQEDNEK